MGSSSKARPQGEPARPRRGRHESGSKRGWDVPAATALGTVVGATTLACSLFAKLPSVVSWPLVLIVTAAAFVIVRPSSGQSAAEIGAQVFAARRLIAVIVLLAAVTTLALNGYLVRQQQTAVRRHAELILGLGLHADLDSKDGNWEQGIHGLEGDIYYDTGRSARPPRAPRIQGGLIGENLWTRLVPLGTGFAVSRRSCTTKLRENPPQQVPVDQLRPGYQLCVETNKRRWAFLTLTGSPGPKRLRFDVMVWDYRQPMAARRPWGERQLQASRPLLSLYPLLSSRKSTWTWGGSGAEIFACSGPISDVRCDCIGARQCQRARRFVNATRATDRGAGSP
jgi:uncharacterized membrane protein YphA (DoxX/SURF4 family)